MDSHPAPSELPVELWDYIFSHMDLAQLKSVSRTCRSFRSATQRRMFYKLQLDFSRQDYYETQREKAQFYCSPKTASILRICVVIERRYRSTQDTTDALFKAIQANSFSALTHLRMRGMCVSDDHMVALASIDHPLDILQLQHCSYTGTKPADTGLRLRVRKLHILSPVSSILVTTLVEPSYLRDLIAEGSYNPSSSPDALRFYILPQFPYLKSAAFLGDSRCEHDFSITDFLSTQTTIRELHFGQKISFEKRVNLEQISLPNVKLLCFPETGTAGSTGASELMRLPAVQHLRVPCNFEDGQNIRYSDFHNIGFQLRSITFHINSPQLEFTHSWMDTISRTCPSLRALSCIFMWRSFPATVIALTLTQPAAAHPPFMNLEFLSFKRTSAKNLKPLSDDLKQYLRENYPRLQHMVIEQLLPYNPLFDQDVLSTDPAYNFTMEDWIEKDLGWVPHTCKDLYDPKIKTP